jgi:hypothetical protein
VAIAYFFGGVDFEPRPSDNASASKSAMPNSPIQQDGSVGSTNDDATTSLISAANNMIQITQELISNTPLTTQVTFIGNIKPYRASRRRVQEVLYQPGS